MIYPIPFDANHVFDQNGEYLAGHTIIVEKWNSPFSCRRKQTWAWSKPIWVLNPGIYNVRVLDKNDNAVITIQQIVIQ